MPLFLRTLLADPSLGLQLVAGAAGLDRRGAVHWAHISEIPDPTPWLEGGELLLTTGLAIASSEALQRRLVAGLDARGCPGIGFGVGVVCDDVPTALANEAERRCLPLFTVPYEVPFLAVTKRVSSEIFEEHYAALRGAVNLQRSVLAAVLADGGARGVLATVAEAMPGLDCVLFDYYGQVLAEGVGSDGGVDTGKLWTGLGGIGTRRDRFDTEVDGRTVHAGVVRMGDTAEAVLAVVGGRVLHEHELLLFEQAVTGVSLELARGLSVREARRGRVDDLLSEVAEHRIGQQALTRSLARLGMDPAAPYQVLCLRTTPQRAGDRPAPDERNVSTLVEDVLTGGDRAPLLGRYDGSLYCLVAPPDGDQGQRVHAALQSRGWSSVRIGRSRPKRGCDQLGAALLEA
ncbi:MAG: PucR family transcriptional regulator ligand-binding domain-containing protein, partial [Actinomycetota bacterium]|nr:PucR family transcriptional regulator ligand-binding domain-containing protein [Actinomycetota bacterium]